MGCPSPSEGRPCQSRASQTGLSFKGAGGETSVTPTETNVHGTLAHAEPPPCQALPGRVPYPQGCRGSGGGGGGTRRATSRRVAGAEVAPPPPVQGAQPTSSYAFLIAGASFNGTFVTDRPNRFGIPPPTAHLTAAGAASEVPSLRMHPCLSRSHSSRQAHRGVQCR